MTREDAALQLAGTTLHAIADNMLIRELERSAELVLALDFSRALPPGSRALMVRFWAFSDELDRRGLPASVAVGRCRFMFPPL
jgi:hypothetical protein